MSPYSLSVPGSDACTGYTAIVCVSPFPLWCVVAWRMSSRCCTPLIFSNVFVDPPASHRPPIFNAHTGYMAVVCGSPFTRGV